MSQSSTSLDKKSTNSRVKLVEQNHSQLIEHLFDHQNRSWHKFTTEGLKDLFDSFDSLTFENIKKGDQNYKIIMNFKSHRFEEPVMTDQQALRNNVTYEAALKVNVELIVKDDQGNNIVKKLQEVYFGEYPWMTDQGNFIINGKKRIVITQIIRSAGVFFEEVEISQSQKLKFNSDQTVFAAKIIPDRGAWLKIETSPRDGVIYIVINHKHRMPVTNFLQAIGMSIDDIYKAFAKVDTGETKFIEETFGHKHSVHDNQSALLEVYKNIKPGDLANLVDAQEALDNKFFNQRHYDLSEVGRYKINQRLNLNTPIDVKHRILHKSDFIAIISELIRLNNSPLARSDDIDDLSNRRLKTVGESILRYFRLGVVRMEKNIRERVLRLEIDDLMPQRLINPRPIVAVVKTFFATSQLSQYMTQENPAAELGHKRRLSAMGPGGLKREYAKFTPRDAHPTHYGRICPVETSEGANIGLLLNMAIYSRINHYGFLETPYYRILTRAKAKDIVGEIAAVNLVDRGDKVIVAQGKSITKDLADKLAKVNPDKEWLVKPKILKDKIVYLDSQQEKEFVILGASAEVDDQDYFINQFAEGRHQSFAGQYQIQDANYIDVSTNQIIGSSAGLIPFIEKDNVVRSLVAANQTRQAVPLINPQSPIVGTGLEEVIAKYSGQIIYAENDGVVTKSTADEVIVKYGKVSKKYPLIHYQRSNQDTSIDQRVVVNTNQKVKKGQPLIEGMSIDQGELALGRDLLVALMSWDGDNFEDAVVISQRLIKDDELTNVLISEYSIEVRETKLGAEITTLDIPNVSEDALSDLDEEGIIRIGARVKTGDILVGKITPKGEQELSNEERLLRAIFGEKAKDVKDTSLRLPNGQSGKVVGVNVFTKDDEDHNLKAGVIKQIQVFVAQSYKVQAGDKIAGRHGNKGVIARVVPEEDMPFTADGQSVDILFNPIGIIARRNLGQIFEAHLGMAVSKLGYKIASPPFNGVTKDKIKQLLKEANLPEDGKQQLYDGRTGEPFKETTVVGYMYIYKLTHMAFNKMHVRSTGPYTMITQQPLGGKSKNGGQRVGEMEVWALSSYGAAYSLQEMLTLKSDDMYGRFKAYESIVKQTEISNPKIPESFNVLVKELQGLGLKLDIIDKNKKLINAEEVVEDNSKNNSKPNQVKSIALSDLVDEDEQAKVLDEQEIDDFFEEEQIDDSEVEDKLNIEPSDASNEEEEVV